jgi:hypothetical protein
LPKSNAIVNHSLQKAANQGQKTQNDVQTPSIAYHIAIMGIED